MTKEYVETIDSLRRRAENAEATVLGQFKEIERLTVDAGDARADVLRLHREKMELFEENLALRTAIATATDLIRNQEPLGADFQKILDETPRAR